MLTAISTIAAAFFGAVMGAIATHVLGKTREIDKENRIRARAKSDVAQSLYHELADRAARCLNDYLSPWKDYGYPELPKKGMTVNRVRKFRPTPPVIYPGLSSKIGLIDSEILVHVLDFFFRLEAWSRDVETWGSILADMSELPKGTEHALDRRLGETLAPARAALVSLGGLVADHEAVEQKMAELYYNIRKREFALRDGLEEMATVARHSKEREQDYHKLRRKALDTDHVL